MTAFQAGLTQTGNATAQIKQAHALLSLVEFSRVGQSRWEVRNYGDAALKAQCTVEGGEQSLELDPSFGLPVKMVLNCDTTRLVFDYAQKTVHGSAPGVDTVLLGNIPWVGTERVVRAPTPKTLVDFTGRWDTSFGEMTFVVQDGGIYATYPSDQGRVFLQRDGQTLTGYWVEFHSSEHCGAQKDGSPYWGSLAMTFNTDLSTFEGQWSYCQQPLAGDLSGTRLSPPPQPEVRLIGDVTILSGDCPAGKSWGKAAVDGEQCFPKVEFFARHHISLGEAQTVAADNDWVMASAQEIQTAWNQLDLNVFAYGMLDDGRFAVPVQTDHPPTFTRGANIGVIGGNQGFFYVSKEAVTRNQVVPPPPNVPAQEIIDVFPPTYNPSGQIPDSILTNPAFEQIKFALYCNTTPGNPMLDGWNNADRPILEEAARALFASEGKTGWRDNIQELLPALQTDPSRRFEFAPFMLSAMWNALVSTNPNSAQVQFRKRFERWAPCDERKIAKMTLALWNNHIGRSNSLDGEHWFGPVKQEERVTLGVLIDTKTGRGSIEGFLPLENPLFLGVKGRNATTMLYRPMVAHMRGSDKLDPVWLREIGQPLNQTFLDIGLRAAGATIAISAIGSAALDYGVKAATNTATVTANIGANTTEDLIRTQAQALQQVAEYGGNQLPWNEALKQAAEKVGSTAGSVADDAATPAAKLALQKAGKQLWGKTLKEALEEAARKAGQEAGELAAKQIASVTAKHVATKVVSAAAVIGAVATFGEIFITVVADAAKTDQYDYAIRQAADKVDTEFTVAGYLGANPDEFQKATLFNQLVKMTIADPADMGLLTLDYPRVECEPGMSQSVVGCLFDVNFHNQAGLSLDQAQQIAYDNGWDLASENDVQSAFDFMGLDVYAFGRMASGRFAVPVQANHSNFSIGANIGATGGNQGFFYTVEKARRSLRKEQLPRPPGSN